MGQDDQDLFKAHTLSVNFDWRKATIGKVK
jgi:hypothetical protein